MISKFGALGWNTFLTIAYVGVLYLLPNSRPSSTLSRNDEVLIRIRVYSILATTAVLCSITAWLISEDGISGIIGALNPGYVLLVVRMIPLPSIFVLLGSSIGLTSVLFMGPLVDKLVWSKGWKCLGTNFRDAIRSWSGVRDYIIGPLTEEVVFRACIISINLSARISPMTSLFFCPLYFGVAHLHHAYEAYASDDEYLRIAIFSSLFQCMFTTVFGWWVSFLFLRTGSIWPSVITHMYCNTLGIPSLTAIDGPAWKTKVYYGLLVFGVVSFALLLKPLTVSERNIM
ncbi:uncharacterized protein V1516DRAFT_674106 [Lipomyces oligophaga]|uniref:uncharacterized protein n=1 Tax=Lipomyces oligophaga TaxID=45792 RepID=UPI0034CE470B